MNLNDIFRNGTHKDPLPEPNAEQKISGDKGAFTVEEIRGFICNPCYAGIGPYPALIDEEAWIRSAAKFINEEGPEQFLVNMFSLLRPMLDEEVLDQE